MSFQDQRMEMALGMGLRIGVLVSSAVTLAGGIWLIATGGDHADVRSFDPNTSRAAFEALLHHGPTTPVALVALGILLLIATPILRVAAMILGFLLERDRTYAIISAIVLCVLIAGLLL